MLHQKLSREAEKGLFLGPLQVALRSKTPEEVPRLFDQLRARLQAHPRDMDAQRSGLLRQWMDPAQRPLSLSWANYI